ncbi:MAG: DUF192 domain-containing protein [Patescibacteria group bacterium]
MAIKSRVIVLVLLLAIILILFGILNKTKEHRESYLTNTPLPSVVEEKTVDLSAIKFEIVDTPALRQKGLSDKESLAPGTGMLFVFDSPSKYSFWMKDMNFPIDIIWLDENFVVVDIKTNVSPSTYPDSFAPSAPSLYVIELNAGVAEQHGISIGTKVRIGGVDNSE